MFDTNLMLNKLEIYKDKFCNWCGRKYPDTILNIEGYIHHKCKIVCLDKKVCEKKAKKNIKKDTKHG